MTAFEWLQIGIGISGLVGVPVAGFIFKSLARLDRELTAFKLEVAKEYVSTSHLGDVVKGLTRHLERIEDKLDAAATRAN